MSSRALLLGALLLGPSGVAAGTLTADLAGMKVELSSLPERPGTAEPTAYTLHLSDSAGAPVSNARVTLQGRMADGMTVVAPLRALKEPGMYQGQVLFTMEGRWDLTLRVKGRGQAFELPLSVEVGR